MSGLFEQPRGEHYIDGGKLFGPTRGRDIDFDVCATCASRESIEHDAAPPFVRCAPLLPGAWLLRRMF